MKVFELQSILNQFQTGNIEHYQTYLNLINTVGNKNYNVTNSRISNYNLVNKLTELSVSKECALHIKSLYETHKIMVVKIEERDTVFGFGEPEFESKTVLAYSPETVSEGIEVINHFDEIFDEFNESECGKIFTLYGIEVEKNDDNSLSIYGEIITPLFV